MEITEVNETWEDGNIKKISVIIRHDPHPPPQNNLKTFIFSNNEDKIEFDEMDMSKGGTWTWSEEEITSLGDAFDLAKRTAGERVHSRSE